MEYPFIFFFRLGSDHIINVLNLFSLSKSALNIVANNESSVLELGRLGNVSMELR